MNMPKVLEIADYSCKKDLLVKSYQEALKKPSFARLVKKLELSDAEAMQITSKLEKSIEELEHCKKCEGLHACQNDYRGHVYLPIRKEGNLYFSYTPCAYYQKQMKVLQEKEAQTHVYENVRMKDIDLSGDKKRLTVIKWLDAFFENYDYLQSTQGLYLYGNFGTGKTFLIQALFHELEIVKHVHTEAVYFPELLRALKDDFELLESKVHNYQRVDLLLLDDIGAERVTEWGRDEILGPILQYRMDHHLPTFFTSNMSLSELENHLSFSNGKSDVVKARRIIERIKQLSVAMELISENRRK